MPCFCGKPAVWFLIDLPVGGKRDTTFEESTASELFEELCDGCFARVVAETERDAWVRRIAGSG